LSDLLFRRFTGAAFRGQGCLQFVTRQFGVSAFGLCFAQGCLGLTQLAGQLFAGMALLGQCRLGRGDPIDRRR
jgi:hypothetical protein